jgi:N6-adenosine-specific RNA methylase IME4
MTADELAERIWDDNVELLLPAYGNLDQSHNPKIFGFDLAYDVSFRGMVVFALSLPTGIATLQQLDAIVNDPKGRVLILPGMAPPTPTVFTTVVADPPWKYGNQAAKGAVGSKYESMTLDAIKGMPVESLVADNAHLYLWTTNTFLMEGHAAEVARAWGFEPKTVITWLKKGRLGVGNYFRGDTEQILFAVRGKLKTNQPQNVRNWFCTEHDTEFFEAPWVQHSRKPAVSYDVIAQKSPGPYLELFARAEPMKAAENWVRWGDQAIGKSQIPILDDYFKKPQAA